MKKAGEKPVNKTGFFHAVYSGILDQLPFLAKAAVLASAFSTRHDSVL
jgi:hypothetical protein